MRPPSASLAVGIKASQAAACAGPVCEFVVRYVRRLRQSHNRCNRHRQQQEAAMLARCVRQILRHPVACPAALRSLDSSYQGVRIQPLPAAPHGAQARGLQRTVPVQMGRRSAKIATRKASLQPRTCCRRKPCTAASCLHAVWQACARLRPVMLKVCMDAGQVGPAQIENIRKGGEGDRAGEPRHGDACIVKPRNASAAQPSG